MTTNIDGVLNYLNRVVKRQAIVFLISDCMDTGFERSLRLTARKHDLTVIRICDPAEDELPDLGLMTLQDPETGRLVTLNTRRKSLRQKWSDYHGQHTAELSELLRKAGVDMVPIYTNGSVVEPLTRLFDHRRKKK